MFCSKINTTVLNEIDAGVEKFACSREWRICPTELASHRLKSCGDAGCSIVSSALRAEREEAIGTNSGAMPQEAVAASALGGILSPSCAPSLDPRLRALGLSARIFPRIALSSVQ
ncbi:MAG: hypothetical protein ACRC46_12410 [Thermoguttaceae bacterium]